MARSEEAGNDKEFYDCLAVPDALSQNRLASRQKFDGKLRGIAAKYG